MNHVLSFYFNSWCLCLSVAFVKAQKSRSYYKRFQVKFKRRREGKTDYRARVRLINQDKNKYNTPKYPYYFSLATGEDFSVEPAETRRPFRALLDVGLIRTTTGNRVFGSFGWFPHSEKRFAGFNKDGKSLDADVHRKYIYGGHTLQEDEPEKYQCHFSEYIKAGVEPDTLEELYKKVHAAKKSNKPQPKEHKRYNLKKLTYDERKQKLIERLNA
ncbi:putative ribosomal protein L5 eukaryotic/L18 archaeal [Helianthus annuus]|nr:putative ribosomal protein L5 eukaryotic/L18 archaeal [Helianthus annuus]